MRTDFFKASDTLSSIAAIDETRGARCSDCDFRQYLACQISAVFAGVQISCDRRIKSLGVSPVLDISFSVLETIVGVNKYRLAKEEEIDVLVVDNTKVRESQVTVKTNFLP